MDTVMQAKKEELLARLREISDLNAATAVLTWDQATYMPPGGAKARGRHLATVRRLAHEKLTDPALGVLLDDLQPYADTLPHEADDAGLLRLTRRKFEEAVRVPADFAAEVAEHTAASYAAWASARPANDFAAIQPLLERTVALSRQYADFFPGYDHPADPHIDRYDYGMTATTVRSIFAELRAQLVPLLDVVVQQPQVDDSFLYRTYPEAAQWRFGMMIAQAFGYDMERGRQDKTHHPFAIKFSHGDVRITTRFDEQNLSEGLFSTMHETGHALYEQGVTPDYEGTLLNSGTSAGVHESQSRLWENLVGRSRGFWRHFYPALQETFPTQLRDVPLDAFYRAINKVERSLIRTDADEVTYNLHVIIRFDLALALLEGTLAVPDLPEAWHARYQADLGLRAPDNRDGVLQDVHWFAGLIGGMFQGYTLGNVMAAQFYAAAVNAHPDIPAQITRGQFDTLHTWLRTNIYRHGSKFTTAELLQRTTGGELRLEPYIDYLRTKYSEIYGFAM